ncbi:EthD domain-containing protein [Halotalea alkalilenta]|uniref:EthD domain-containing protein n=1 Tax=Halotalea alkalilenta TaxID=376489 RepID=UPI0004860AB3|nr:EthD domain-containing protein [Halotalea alkalilenta]
MPIKMIAASHRRPGLTRSEYFRYLEHYHGTVARIEPFQIKKYLQYHVLDGAFGMISDKTHKNRVADRDGVVELQFDTIADMLNALSTGEGGSRASRDGQYFADERNNITTMAEEFPVAVPNPMPAFNPGLGEPGEGGLRVLQYLMRRPEVFWSDFHALWHEAHARALEKSPHAKEMFRRITLNLRSRANDNDAAAREHFKMVDPPVYDAIVITTLDTIEHASAFRQYFDAFMDDANDFIDFSESFYLYARQARIIDNIPEHH